MHTDGESTATRSDVAAGERALRFAIELGLDAVR